MRTSKTWTRIAGGAAVAAAAALLVPTAPASAKGTHQNRGGALKLTDIDVGATAGVAQNHIVNIYFTQQIDPATVKPASIRVRAINGTSTGYTIDVAGTFQVAGSVVRFYPRLPTHLRDPKDGNFYAAGTEHDDANLNAGFQPNRNHRITVIGAPIVPGFFPVRSLKGKVLDRDYAFKFTTSPGSPKSDAFTTDTYSDPGEPGFEFSNPPDKVASAADQYARHGGSQDVPSAIGVTLFGKKIPLSPDTVRKSGNVTLTMISRKGDPSVRKPIQGTPFIEQNFDTVGLVFQPRFPLPDLGTYAMKVSRDVLDLTETLSFSENSERLRVRQIYDYLDFARTLSPGTPYEQLSNPDPDITPDWPRTGQADGGDAIERGILQANVLALGDNFPDEIDPRVMILFTTRDEPISHAVVLVNFIRNTSEDFYDAKLSTADWDAASTGGVAGAASAVFTFAGGSGTQGDFNPSAATTVSGDTYAQNTVNWRKVNIPPNVFVKVTGTRPVTIKAQGFQLDGEIRADGNGGSDVPTSANYSYTISQNSPSPVPGGPGGPGGGPGGIGNNTFTSGTAGGTGVAGNDVNGSVASTQAGGQGGKGGKTSVPTTSPGYYSFGGGGGGGGARTAGSNGANGGNNQSPYASWNGSGGAGGAGALANDTLTPMVGGAGGGAGGVGGYFYYSWGVTGGTGGGGGGALTVQTSSVLTVGTGGAIRARGGKGGQGSGIKSTWSSGPGGGGGGGSILIRSSKGFNIANPAAAFDVSGGAGGTQTGTYTAPNGGAGGTGFLRVEDPNGGISIPSSTAGVYNPVGGGVPSYVYSKWIDVGVDNPRLSNFKGSDFVLNASNDAIFIEMQAAIEDPAKFGFPKTTAVDANQNSTNVNEVSQWMPIRLVDNTNAGGAFTVPGNTSSDAIFPIEQTVAGKNYKWFRVRITFQLDPTQTAQSPVPFVDLMIVHFDFNF